jgi:nucleoside-diphosphate-sugar epimerase
MSESKEILVLGGTKFMGYSLVTRLLELKHRVTIAHRGKKYWKQRNPFGDSVKEVKCDRDDQGSFRTAFQDHLSNLPSNFIWNAVVDFSAFETQDMEVIHFP